MSLFYNHTGVTVSRISNSSKLIFIRHASVFVLPLTPGRCLVSRRFDNRNADLWPTLITMRKQISSQDAADRLDAVPLGMLNRGGVRCVLQHSA